MRIRQVRPEFFTDPVTAGLAPAVQVTYIGLWCIADDAGWLAWDPRQIGALLYPYKSVPVRERSIRHAGEVLAAAGRLVIHGCGHAVIPKLVEHQRIGGNKTYSVRDEHRVHTDMDLYARNVTLGNVTVGNGTAGAGEREAPAPSAKERLAAYGYTPDKVSA